MRFLQRFVLILTMLAAYPVLADSSKSFTWDGLKRHYLLHHPHLTGVDKRPLIIALHGAWSSPRKMAAAIGLNSVSDRQGFWAVYPEGVYQLGKPLEKHRAWNADGCCSPATDRKVDDVGFIAQLIEELEKHYPIDPKKVYVLGASNGAMLAHLLAARSLPLAGAAAIEGALPPNLQTAASSVPILIVHGHRDEVVPFDGGVDTQDPSLHFLSVVEATRFWTKVNCCVGDPTVHASADGQTTERVWAHCRNRNEVELIELRNGIHEWPAVIELPDGTHATTAEVAWAFFAKHSR